MTLIIYRKFVFRVITWFDGKRWGACPEGLPDLVAYNSGPGGAVANLGYLLDKKEKRK